MKSSLNPRQVFMICNKTSFYGELSTSRQSWKTTPCRPSATSYSIYSQLPSILEAVPPSVTWGRFTTARQCLYSEPNKSISQRPLNISVRYIFILSSYLNHVIAFLWVLRPRIFIHSSSLPYELHIHFISPPLISCV
jgi:hypothetical protein